MNERAAAIIKNVAQIITHLEWENDCVGALALHMHEILEVESGIHPNDLQYIRHFAESLAGFAENLEIKEEFDGIINAGFTPEEVETLTQGGENE